MKSLVSLAFRSLTLLFLCLSVVSFSQAGRKRTPPIPQSAVAPELTKGQNALDAEVVVRAKVNKHGLVESAKVVSSSDQRLNDACVEAMQRWVFRPAERNGRPVGTKVNQPFVFNGGSILMSGNSDINRPPKPLKRVSPQLPERFSSINGFANLVAEINAEGKVERIAPKGASHPELLEYASEALKEWKFRPAIKAGEPVSAKVVAPFVFNASPESRRRAIEASYEIDQVDSPPVVARRHEPVLPLAQEKETGEAWLLLYIDAYGYVAEADTLKTTNPALSRAATRAALNWTFAPAVKDGKPVPSKMAVPFHFSKGLLLADKPADRQPRVKRSVAPKLPSQSKTLNGFVRVVLDLDEKGEVVAAQAKSSSDEQLVQPVLEAARKWRFEPALRGGTPVPSSVLVPFEIGRG